MARKPGDDIRVVIGPKSPKEYAVTLDRLRQITLILRPKKAVPDAFCERLRVATSLYVKCATSHELAPKGRIVTVLDQWSARSRAVRSKIWTAQTNTTARDRSRAVLAEIQQQYFGRDTELYVPLHGHRRHLMANAALGLDVALKLCQYVLQELKAEKRGNHARDLWEVWIAHIIAEFRVAGFSPIIKLKPKLKTIPRFSELIGALEETLPDPKLKRKYKPAVFRRRFKRAAMLSRRETPANLARLMTLWGNYDRVQRTKNESLNKLLKRARLLYPLRTPAKQRGVVCAAPSAIAKPKMSNSESLLTR